MSSPLRLSYSVKKLAASEDSTQQRHVYKIHDSVFLLQQHFEDEENTVKRFNILFLFNGTLTAVRLFESGIILHDALMVDSYRAENRSCHRSKRQLNDSRHLCFIQIYERRETARNIPHHEKEEIKVIRFNFPFPLK